MSSRDPLSTRRGPRPGRALVALRIEATLLMSLAVGQAGLAAGFLGGDSALLPAHQLNAYLLLALTAVVVVTAVLYQRAGGPRWPVWAAGILIGVEVLQIVLARSGIVGLHIFCGVLFVVMATLLTSYLFRPGFVPTV